MNIEDNGNVTATCSDGDTTFLKPNSSSTEDLSEYTDADESISAPTEFLAEFLSAVMLKDYDTALKYCKLILQYEPNNVTAKEFYPLILEKLANTSNKNMQEQEDSSGSASEQEDSSSAEAESSSSSGSSEASEEEEEEGDDRSSDPPTDNKRSSSDGDATTASYSSLEDEEAEADQLDNLVSRFRLANVDLDNGNKIICDSTSGKIWEENLNNTSTIIGLPFGTSSDSESPTEPFSQQTIALLRAKIIPPRR